MLSCTKYNEPMMPKPQQNVGCLLLIYIVHLGQCVLDRENMLDDYDMDLDIPTGEKLYEFGAHIMLTTLYEYIYHVEAIYHKHDQRPTELNQHKIPFLVCVKGVMLLLNPVIQWI